MRRIPDGQHFYQRPIIFVDGDVDVYGVVEGYWTVYATGDIGLIDNFVYAEADRSTGRFNPARTHSMAALVSEKNIIIRNTVANGKDDGCNNFPNDLSHQAIAIDGSLIALNESFTFEQQNDEWDRYQGPEPDVRGMIYLTGGIAQKRRGYVHRFNHIGTGYGRWYYYDDRLRHDAPPGFAPAETPELSGHFDEVELWYNRTYTLTDVSTEAANIRQGARLNLSSGNALTVNGDLTIEGTAQNPVVIACPTGVATITVTSSTTIDLKWVNLGPGIELVLNSESFTATNCSFGGVLSVEGNAVIDSCRFGDVVNLSGFGDYSVHRSVFRNGLNLNGGRSDGAISNCTFVDSRNAGIRLRGRAQPVIVNSIIAHNRFGVLNDTRYDQTLRYCDVIGNADDDLVDATAGEGCISLDPQFLNLESGDVQLDWKSPCIDSGDPTSPRDPDGSTADMGAVYFDQELGAPRTEFGIGNLEFGIDAAPNPFNDQTCLTSRVPQSGVVRIAVYDLNGRMQMEVVNREVEAGRMRFVLDASNWPAGVYLVTLQAGKEIRSVKIVKLN